MRLAVAGWPRRLVATTVTALLVLAVAAVGVGAEGALSIELEPGHAYPEVGLVVTVPGAIAASGLNPANVVVRESGEVRTAELTRIPGDRVEVVIVIDTSGSMTGAAMDAARLAASSFVDRMPAEARVGVVGFSNTSSVAVPLSADHRAVKAAISGLQAGGETALYDGVLLALDQFPVAGSLRRQVVVLSDGADTASFTSLADVTSRLASSGVRLDAVALATGQGDESALQQMSQSGRGTFARAIEATSLAGIYEELGHNVANQYRVTFKATGHGATALKVEVQTQSGRAVGELQLNFPPAPATSPPSSVLSTPTTAIEQGANTPRPADDPRLIESAGRWLLVLGAAAWFLAIAIGAAMVSLPSRRSLLARRPRDRGSVDRNTPSMLGQRLSSLADTALERRGLRDRLNAALERAGIELRPGEFVMIVMVTAVACLLTFSLIGGPLLGVIVAAASVVGAKLVVRIKTRRRQGAFTTQLSDALQLMSNSLRTGYAVTQAMNVVATEAESPIRDEFRRVLLEVRLGRDLGGALRAMADRMAGEDVNWMIQAMEINREVGGDLAEVLDNVAVTIRERDHLRGQVQAVSAEGRLSAYVLVALPIALGGVLAVVNPNYFSELTHGVGLVLVGVGVAMLVCGSIVLNRLVKIDF